MSKTGALPALALAKMREELDKLEQAIGTHGDSRWQLVLACGHRYFLDRRYNKIAVADESGALPDLTDDGVLFLDRDAPITMEGGQWYIPLKGLRGIGKAAWALGEVITKTPAGWHEVVAVAYQWRMKVVAPHTGEEIPLVKAIDAIKPCSNCGELGADHQNFSCKPA